MAATEIFGLILALLFGAAALTPVAIRLIRNPAVWEMWFALGTALLLLVIFLAVGFGDVWGGCDTAPDTNALVCPECTKAAAVPEWDPACRKHEDCTHITDKAEKAACECE